MQMSAKIDYLTVSILETDIVNKFTRRDVDLDKKWKTAKYYPHRMAVELPSRLDDDEPQYTTLSFQSETGDFFDATHGLISLGGSDLNNIDGLKTLTALGLPEENGVLYDEMKGRITRLDLALDLFLGTGDEAQFLLDKMFKKLSRACGYKSGLQKFDMSKTKILSGKNKNSRIESCELHTSNGTTLYIGSHSSNFMMRVYDKTAELNKGLDESKKIDDKILRLELQTRQDLAHSVAKSITRKAKDDEVDSINDIDISYLLGLWHTVVDEHLRFKTNKGKAASVWTFLELPDKPKIVEFDYMRYDRQKLSTETWLRTQVSKAFRREVLSRMRNNSLEEYLYQEHKLLVESELRLSNDTDVLQNWIDDEFEKRGRNAKSTA